MKNIPLVKYIVVFVFLLLYTGFLFVFPSIDNDNNASYKSIIWALSLVGLMIIQSR